MRWLPFALVGAVLLGLLIGSLADVSSQSTAYHRATDRSFSALATDVVRASNRTGSALATLMNDAPTIPNSALPFTARGQIQQGLDAAVSETEAEYRQAAAIGSPSPSGSVGARFAAVMQARAAATLQLRTDLDRFLGMVPLPVAGSPSASDVVSPGPPLSSSAAAVALGGVGTSFEQSDRDYRGLLADIHAQRDPIRLPASLWVPSPVSLAPLGSTQLAALPPALDASAALVPYHHLVLTAVGFEPPAVPPSPGSPAAAAGAIGTPCGNAVSVGPGTGPTTLPPTASISVKTTITNCGTVDEAGATVTATVALADPAGTAPPSPGHRGGTTRTTVTLRAGGSNALVFGPVEVASGHTYVVTLVAAAPNGEPAVPDGSTQQFVVQITG